MGTESLRKIARHQLDLQQWDRAVASDPIPLPYGLSWWLDAVTDGHWEGLVLGDYRAVFPLPRMKRLGVVPALIRPPFTQQLGPFGNLLPADLTRILARIPRSFQVSLGLSTRPGQSEIPGRFQCTERTNLVLPLDAPIAELRRSFPGKLRAYLRKTTEDRLEVMGPDDFVSLSRQELLGKGGLQEAHFQTLHRLIVAANAHGKGQCWQLREGGELLAANFAPHWRGRTINLAAASTDRGRKRRGMSRLLDLHFQAGAGQKGAIFDFEGSDLPGVRDFFTKFGAVNAGYVLIEERLFGLG